MDSRSSSPTVAATGLLDRPWSRTDRPVPRVVVQPLQRFLHLEMGGGVVLVAMALVALAWANSPWASTYEHLWQTEVGVEIGSWTLRHSLHFWVNDLLMAVFFFVVGLEIKRELVHGELRDPRAAALPVLAAVGGMVVPALLYLAVNAGGPGAHGWGVPMATDIASPSGSSPWWGGARRWASRCSCSAWQSPTTSGPSW